MSADIFVSVKFVLESSDKPFLRPIVACKAELYGYPLVEIVHLGNIDARHAEYRIGMVRVEKTFRIFLLWHTWRTDEMSVASMPIGPAGWCGAQGMAGGNPGGSLSKQGGQHKTASTFLCAPNEWQGAAVTGGVA